MDIQNFVAGEGQYYVFSKEKVDEMVKCFLKEKTGLDLTIEVCCLEENYDVVVFWNPEEEEMALYEKYVNENENPFVLSMQEGFMNRDYIFSKIFNADTVVYEFNEETEEFKFFVQTIAKDTEEEPMQIVQKPLTDEEIKEMVDEDNYISGVVIVSAYNMINGNYEDFLEGLSMKLINRPTLYEIQWEIVGHFDSGSVLIEVSGFVENDF